MIPMERPVILEDRSHLDQPLLFQVVNDLRWNLHMADEGLGFPGPSCGAQVLAFPYQGQNGLVNICQHDRHYSVREGRQMIAKPALPARYKTKSMSNW